MREVPVYLIAGFLDGGKTSFINDIMAEGFAGDARTVILCCEEGEVEYSPATYRNAKIVTLENEEDLTEAFFKELRKKYRPDQIIIEYNGMWLLDSLVNNLPGDCILYQIMTFVDAATFEPYSKNLGQLMMEKIKFADLVVFNRCTDELKAKLRGRNLRMVNRNADFVLEDPSGEAENYLTGDECFFDLDQPVIDIPDDDYGLWFVDIMDHPERYKGKKVHMKMQMSRSGKYKGTFTPGRLAMVCCEADIAFYGMMAKGDLGNYRDGEWIEVTAEAGIAKHPAFEGGEGPFLKIESVTRCKRPVQEVVTF